MFFLTSCTLKSKDSKVSIVDYNLDENWAYYATGKDKTVDLFFIGPTTYMGDQYNMSIDDSVAKKNFLGTLNREREVYEENTRMYAPYYRQAAIKVYKLNLDERERYMQVAYSDISAAFSYYLEKENNGRPIILAGFSQGADMCYRLLEEYFSQDSLYNQLVAVYAIG